MNREVRNLIEATIATHPTASAEEVAQLVANNTPLDAIRQHYRDLLVYRVRQIAAEQRRVQTPPRPKPQPTPPASQTKAPPLSPKLAERRTWWQQQLATEIVVGYREHKVLADCTIEDLRRAEKECDAAIGRQEERMGTYRHLVDLMTKHGVGRVRQLPAQQDWRRTR